MKRFLLSAAIAMMATVAMAQTNPVKGYIITNLGDSLQGLVDLRTDAINSKQCTFKQDGKDSYVTYKPGNIKGYGFHEQNKHYASQRLKVENKLSWTFVEQLVNGQMKLYSYTDKRNTIYYFENEYGMRATYVNETVDTHLNTVAEKGRELQHLRLLFANSPRAIEMMTTDMSRADLIRLAAVYHKDVTGSSETSKIVTTSSGNVAKPRYSLRLTAGYTSYLNYPFKGNFIGTKDFQEGKGNFRYIVGEKQYSGFNVGLGLDAPMNNMSKDVILNLDLGVSFLSGKLNVDKEVFDNEVNDGGDPDGMKDPRQYYEYINSENFTMVTIGLGITKVLLSDKSVNPLLRCGINGVVGFNNYTQQEKLSNGQWGQKSKKQSSTFGGAGLYLGTGVQFRIAGNTALLLTADYNPQFTGRLTHALKANIGIKF